MTDEEQEQAITKLEQEAQGHLRNAAALGGISLPVINMGVEGGFVAAQLINSGDYLGGRALLLISLFATALGGFGVYRSIKEFGTFQSATTKADSQRLALRLSRNR